jgi:NAD-dependent dihydropyrimidine dehydrogenase PreA subunit
MSKAKINQASCIGCGACEGTCPVAAIKLNAEGKAEVDQAKCIGCGACEGSCPVNTIKVE